MSLLELAQRKEQILLKLLRSDIRMTSEEFNSLNKELEDIEKSFNKVNDEFKEMEINSK